MHRVWKVLLHGTWMGACSMRQRTGHCSRPSRSCPLSRPSARHMSSSVLPRRLLPMHAGLGRRRGAWPCLIRGASSTPDQHARSFALPAVRHFRRERVWASGAGRSSRLSVHLITFPSHVQGIACTDDNLRAFRKSTREPTALLQSFVNAL